jgi:hypothetical protein
MMRTAEARVSTLRATAARGSTLEKRASSTAVDVNLHVHSLSHTIVACCTLPHGPLSYRLWKSVFSFKKLCLRKIFFS